MIGLMDPDIAATRNELVLHLFAGDAHQSFLDSVVDFPVAAINLRPPNVGYTFWQLVEHVRFCQYDMLDYLRNPAYREVVFPDDYWPEPQILASEQQWVDTVAAFANDLKAVETFVQDAGTDLWVAAAHAWEPAHTPLRTVMVMIDHNAYHGGEMGILRQVMNLWPQSRIDTFTVHAIDTQNRL